MSASGTQSGKPSVDLPIFSSLSGYRPAWLRDDVAAGLAVAAVGLPSAIAYPAIAGLPPETGIYASIAPLVAYAAFGPSRQLIVGPEGSISALVGAAILPLAAAGSSEASELAAMLALLVRSAQPHDAVLGWVDRLDRYANVELHVRRAKDATLVVAFLYADDEGRERRDKILEALTRP